MATWKQIVESSLREIASLEAGESASDVDIDYGIERLKGLISQWDSQLGVRIPTYSTSHGAWDGTRDYIVSNYVVHNYIQFRCHSDVDASVVSPQYSEPGIGIQWQRYWHAVPDSYLSPSLVNKASDARISYSAQEALIFNLAVRLSPSFGKTGQQLPDSLVAHAAAGIEMLRTRDPVSQNTIEGTWGRLVEDALREIQVIQEGQTVDKGQLDRGVERIRDLMLDWKRRGILKTVPAKNDMEIGDDIQADFTGIEEALRLNLAVALAPSFAAEKAVSEQFIARALDAVTSLSMRQGDPTTTTAGTWGRLVEDALREIQVIREGQTADKRQLDRGIERLRDLMLDWERRGIFTTIPVKADMEVGDSIQADYASVEEALRLNLSVALAPSFAAEKAVSEQFIARALDAMNSVGRRHEAPTKTTDGTWGRLVEDALREIQVIQEGETADKRQLDRGIERLRDLMLDWKRRGIFTTIPVKADMEVGDSIQADYAGIAEALRLNLAVALAPSFAAEKAVSEQFIARALDAVTSLSMRHDEPTPTAANTFGRIVEDALREIQVIREGQTASKRQIERGLERLKDLMRDWKRRGIFTTLPSHWQMGNIVQNELWGVEEALRLNLAVALAPSFAAEKAVSEQFIARAMNAMNSVRLRQGDPTETTDGTWGRLVEDALREIQVIREGQTADKRQLNRGLARLKEMLEQWALRGGLVEGYVRLDHTVSELKYSYEIEDGGQDIDGTPPAHLESVIFQPSGEGERLRLVRVDPASIAVDTVGGIQGLAPQHYSWERAGDKGIIRFSNLLTVGDWFQLIGRGWVNDGTFSETDAHGLPDGHSRAIRLNLAVELVPSFGRKESFTRNALVFLTTQARNSRSIIRFKDYQPVTSQRDPALSAIGRRNSGWLLR